MKTTKLFAGIIAAATAVSSLAIAANAYDLGDKALGKNWSLNCTIPAEAFADLTADSYVTITYTTDDDAADADGNEYWSIKPMDSTWAFIDPNGEGGPTLAEGKDAYPVEKGTTSITFKVPADYLESIKSGGMIIIGHALHLQEMTISDEAPTAPAPDNGNTDAPTADKNTPDTGVEGVAVIAALAIVATGAVVVARKRK